MEKYQELSYIHQLGLKNLQKVQAGYVCSCPICGDSQHHKYKRRCYILDNKLDFITVHCHKCGLTTNFKKFISMVSPAVYEDYIQEEKKYLLTKGHIFQKKIDIPNTKVYDYDLTLFKLNSKSFIPALSNEKCIAYINKRKIPSYVAEQLFYCTKEKLPCYDMIIFPFKKENLVYGFQGRSLSGKKFYIHSKNDSFKVYNIFNVDWEKPVYIFESIIDSLYTPNSITCLGSDISEKILSLLKEPVFVFDNDKVGILKATKYAQQGYKIFIWPTGIKGKDVNELIVKWNFQPETIYKMIKNNIKWDNSAIVNLKIAMRYKR